MDSIERQTQKLENEWRESEPALRQRIQLLKAERTQLQIMIDESKAATTDVEAQRKHCFLSKVSLKHNRVGRRALTGVVGQVDTFIVAA